MRWRRLLLAALAAGAGCGRDAGTGPPEILYGQDICAHCGMIISDERFAAAAVMFEDGRRVVRAYDDVGCMLEDDPGAVAVRWVRGYRDGQWHDAGSAVYLASPKLHTPMASGLAAFGSRADALAARKELEGVILDLDSIKEGAHR